MRIYRRSHGLVGLDGYHHRERWSFVSDHRASFSVLADGIFAENGSGPGCNSQFFAGIDCGAVHEYIRTDSSGSEGRDPVDDILP